MNIEIIYANFQAYENCVEITDQHYRESKYNDA